MSKTEKIEIIASPRSEKVTFSRAATPKAQTPRVETPKVQTPRADVEKNEASVTEVKVGRGFYVSRNVIIGVVAGSLLFILAIGLLSGLVFREIDICEESSNNVAPTTSMPYPCFTSSMSSITKASNSTKVQF